MKILTIVLLFFLLSFSANGQGFDMGSNYDTLGIDQRTEMSVQAITDLKSGVLVLRLRTGSAKVDALGRLISSPSLDADERARFEKQKAELLSEIQQENEDLIAAFAAKYSFSRVLFIPDTAVQRLKDGEQSGYFLNKKMELDPNISLNQSPFLVAFHGLSHSARTSGVEGIVVLDDQFQELVEPFPYFTGMTTMKKKLAFFFNKVEEGELLKQLVSRFDKRLGSFYEEVN